MSIRLDIQLQSDRSVLSPVSSTWRYGFAVLAVLAALGVRLVLFPLLGDHAPYLPFILAVMVSARFGGRWPGVAATLASALGVAWFALPPKRSFAVADPHEMASLALFVAVALLVSLMVGQLRESLRSSIQAQLALQRESELIDLSHDAIVATDPGRRILRWNAGAAEMYGAPEHEAAGRVIHDYLQTTGDMSTAGIDEVLHRTGRWEGELCHVTRDGRSIIVDNRQILQRDEENQPTGILEINRDITERKRAEEALRQASEQRKLALEAANMGAWEFRFDTGKVIWDERCRQIFGAPAAGEIDHDQVMLRIHPDDRAATEKALQQTMAGADVGDREYRIVSTDGTVHWVASHGRVLFEGEADRRRAVRCVGVCMDITGRKQAEERLRETQKLETIGSLAGGVAHDFNNLLCIIMGSASLVLTQRPTCEHSQAILSAWSGLPS